MKLLPTLFLSVFLLSCTAESTTDKTEDVDSNPEGITVVNGVERSELALTMRDMYDQMKLVRDSLKEGHSVKTNYLETYRSIHTDHATEPEKIDEAYHGLADNFIQKYEAYERAEDNKIVAFNNMLDACLACHSNKCPGPIKAIKKLKLKNT
ncbi:MAG: hypothetical protein Salg2KO_09860 [Salibacteraceae bacterium]